VERLLIVGIDGADWEYVSGRLESGGLPVLRGIAEKGAFGLLRSTRPPLSCPAWPAMTTGLTPQRLDLYDLTVPDGYGKRVANAADVAAPRLWDYVGAEGGRSLIMNVPVTWPPRPIAGTIVAGFLSPRGAQVSCPAGVAEDLAARFGYSAEHVPSRRGKLERVAAQTDAFVHLLTHDTWNLAMVVFGVTDWAQHDHWGDRTFVDRLFDRVDAALQPIMDAARSENVAVISDHGFTGAERILNVNRLLANGGLLVYGTESSSGTYRPNLALKDKPRRGVIAGLGRRLGGRRILRAVHSLGLERALDLIPSRLWHALKKGLDVWDTPIDWSRTRAYLLNGLPQTVRVNLAGREPQGIVPPAAYEDTCREVAETLRDAVDPFDGRPICAEVLTRSQVLPDCTSDLAPDVFFEVRDDAYMVSPADHPEVVWRTGKTRGRHRYGGIYALCGPAFRPGVQTEASLIDMTPTGLAAMDCPVPEGVDGQADVRLLAAGTQLSAKDYGLNVDEVPGADDGSVMQRLGDLGYV
jgi:predicted AlkP superfamily phosphohydrolase/phosphomutase